MATYEIEKIWDDNEAVREGANGRIYLSRGRWRWFVLADGRVVDDFATKREAVAAVDNARKAAQ
jgi:hypothetical protein